MTPAPTIALVVVEHGHLTRRDREGGLLEAERESVVRRLHARGNGVGAVAELRLGTLDRQVEPAANAHLAHLERAARADRERVRRRVGSEGVDRLRGGEPDPAALSGRVPPDPVVTAELDAVLVDDRAGPAARAPAARGTCGSRRRRGSTPPGSRRARQRRGRRRPPRRGSRACPGRRAGTRRGRAAPDRPSRACRTDPWPGRRRARSAAARRARRSGRSGPSRARRHRPARRSRRARRTGSDRCSACTDSGSGPAA